MTSLCNWQQLTPEAPEYEFAGGEKVVMAKESLAPGGVGALHRHDRTEEFILVVEGQVTMTIGEGELTLGPGDAVVIAPKTVHGLHTDGGATLYATFAPSEGRIPIDDYHPV